MPKHIPRKGIFFNFAKLIALIFPSAPSLPKPPGTSIPSNDLKTFSVIFLFFSFLESIQEILTVELL